MIYTKVEFASVRISQIHNIADLSKLLFPGNLNHQYAFMVIWMILRWQPESIVANLATRSYSRGVSRRTFERVRAKMRRMGLIQFVSRFDRSFGNREGWVLSTRFEQNLQQLRDTISQLRDIDKGSLEEDERLIEIARRSLKATKHSNDDMA